MSLKFVMYPSGVGLFPETATHDQCYIVNNGGQSEKPVAAGFVGLKRDDNGCESISFSGRSINLRLDANSVYPDWMERHVQSRLAPQRKTYGMGGEAFFLPFKEIQRYGAGGVGRSSPGYGEAPELVTLEEVIRCLKNSRR